MSDLGRRDMEIAVGVGQTCIANELAMFLTTSYLVLCEVNNPGY